MSAIAWTTIERAIHAWVVTTSGLATDHVIWAAQGGPPPSGTFIRLRLMSARQLGHDWTEVVGEGDDQALAVRGFRKLTLSMQCFGGDPIGGSSPHAVLDDVRTGAALPDVRAALQAGGVGLGQLEEVQSTDGRLNTTVFEPRAILTATLQVTSELVQAPAGGGPVESAEIVGLLPNDAGDGETPVDEILVYTVPDPLA